MVLDIRKRQLDNVVRMLSLNAPPTASKHEEDTYKILVIDKHTKDILAPLIKVNELRQHGVTLHLLLESEREPIPDVPAVYFIKSSRDNIQRLISDAQKGLYDSMHLNFALSVPRPLMEELAQGFVAANALTRVGKIYDQYLSFISLESSLFSLGLPDVYATVNDPNIQDEAQMEAAINPVVDGLLAVLVTAGVVPIIRCPPGGIAQHVAEKLNARLRDSISHAKSNLFGDGGGMAAALQRPLLCLFDRDFDLSVLLEHPWLYKALVQDVLGMKLNKVDVASGGVSADNGVAPNKRSYELFEGDFFWDENGRQPFPYAAEQVDVELKKYQQQMEEINALQARAAEGIDQNSLLQQTAAAVQRLPELTNKKRLLDKHMVLLHSLLDQIKRRSLDKFHEAEEQLLQGKKDWAGMLQLISTSNGSATDKLRLAIIALLVSDPLPSDAELASLESALQSCGVNTASLAYVRRNRRLNLTASVPRQGGMNLGLTGFSASQGNLLKLWDSAVQQGLNQMAKGMKHLFSGARQAVVTMAVASLMDPRPGSEVENFLVFDPKSVNAQAAQERAKQSYKDAIVFMIGGGNFLEHERLRAWAQQAATPKHVLYGCTDLLSASEFCEQLAELGRKCGTA